jgi:hypothetical protein
MVDGDRWRQRTAASHEKCAWVPCTIRIPLWEQADKERWALRPRSEHTDSKKIRAADVGAQEFTNIFASKNLIMV